MHHLNCRTEARVDGPRKMENPYSLQVSGTSRPSSSVFLELLAMKNIIQSLNHNGSLDKQRVLVQTDS